MATMNPDWNTIQNLKQNVTEGELHLLRFLDENLDNSYEVYFQPYLNGDRPDIVIMRKDSGVLIIEVKDWDLKHYKNIKGEWFVLKDGREHHKLSPYKQVKNYKENLFNLHIPTLLEKKIKNQKMFSIVNCALYFHNSNMKEYVQFINEERSDNMKYIRFFTPDLLTTKNFQEFLNQTYMNRKSQIFTEDLYNRFKRIFQPPYHTVEEGIQINYSKEQYALTLSQPGNKKIKGPAGSGKTMVLAKRAVNSHLRTKKKVLILCYNITLKNYIHDLLSKVKENFHWSNFEINNYHNFISHFLNNVEISPKELFINALKKDKSLENYANFKTDFENLLEKIIEDLGSDRVTEIWEKAIYSNYDFFLKLSIPQTDKYDSILIDEVQDYNYEWLKIIKDCFLNPGGEYVLFGDEKQNIYERELDVDKKPKTNIPGGWDESLKKSFRLHKNIASIATEFQIEFLKNYTFESIETVEQQSLFNQNNLKIEYYELIDESKVIAKFIYDYINSNALSSNDVAILGPVIYILREIDYEFRQVSREKTSTTFETQEVFNFLFHNNFEKIAKKDKENKLNKEYLDGNLQIALQKIIKKINILENREVNSELINQNMDQNDNRINKLVNKISPRIKMEIENIRKNKKFNFLMNSGLVKLSTIHSFKGWEVPSLFLILDSSLDKYPKHELIYTALTRCRFNLIIINISSNIYSDFFRKRSNNNLQWS